VIAGNPEAPYPEGYLRRKLDVRPLSRSRDRGGRPGARGLFGLGLLARPLDRGGLEGNPPRPIVTARPFRLLVALRPGDEVLSALDRGLPGVDWTYADPARKHEWATVEAMFVGSVERELGEFDPVATPLLAFVQRLYTGVDGFPFQRFPDSVKIAGNVGAYAPFVAEHAVALALAAARAVVPVQSQVRAHHLRPPPVHRLLWRRTAVILGYGEIGRAIAARLAPFDMRIVGVNRTGRMSPGCDAVYPADRLREALAVGDFVFEARPLTLRTAGTIGAEELRAMPPHAVFVNVGRAGTVQEEALYRHLVDHPEFRTAIDVWWEEEFATGTFAVRFPFIDLPNFVGTPHCAGVGPSVDTYVLEKAVQNLARFFRGETPLYVVDRRDYVAAGPSVTRPEAAPPAHGGASEP
jgi:phosphoglycerate dehydrogenase-like enzyme